MWLLGLRVELKNSSSSLPKDYELGSFTCMNYLPVSMSVMLINTTLRRQGLLAGGFFNFRRIGFEREDKREPIGIFKKGL